MMAEDLERNYQDADMVVVEDCLVVAEVADKLKNSNTTSELADVNSSVDGDCTDGRIGVKSAFHDVREKTPIHWRKDDGRNRLGATGTGHYSNLRSWSAVRDREDRGIKSVEVHRPA